MSIATLKIDWANKQNSKTHIQKIGADVCNFRQSPPDWHRSDGSARMTLFGRGYTARWRAQHYSTIVKRRHSIKNSRHLLLWRMTFNFQIIEKLHPPLNCHAASHHSTKMPFRTAQLKNNISVHFAHLYHIAISPERAVHWPGAAFFRSFLAEQKRT